ncbi:MAG: A/G-specific adenine glycosylase [Bacteroidota bacterium]|nr:A/G-specific adenine glycosylase [Bacteroidota bacterium]
MLTRARFINKLFLWHEMHPRYLPWAGENNPYKIWISEIILQQTRLEQGIPYFLKFINRFPDLTSLAKADLQEVLKYWEGLGYYSRARNLHAAAQWILLQNKGQFPTEYEMIRNLKGIGDYTAAAISSFAFNKAFPVMDGNVIRVISRIVGFKKELNSQKNKNELKEILQSYFSSKEPARFNQAIMNFGAIHCKPFQPFCHTCPFKKSCYAYQNNVIDEIPKKKLKINLRPRYFHYFIFIDSNNNCVLQHRTRNDIWKGLYDFPMIELKKEDTSNPNEIIETFKTTINFSKKFTTEPYFQADQKLSHQWIHAKFYLVKVTEISLKNDADFILVKQKNLRNFAFPKIINVFLETFLTT